MADFTRFQHILENDNYENRAKFKHLLSDPLFTPRFGISLRFEREVALERLQTIANNHLISVYDFERNPLNVLAAHELVGMVDGSVATKMTVNWNLYGGTLINLGGKRHRKYLDDADSMKAMGCFALTELGYGNNAVEMETTATFLPASHWITNGAVHAKLAVVFAQTIVHGKNEGIHAFIVPIRHDDLRICKGVTIRDMGYKLACNGVDNGLLAFDHVKVSAENLLNKYSDIDANGNFVSSIQSRRARFITVADQLLAGRLCISAMCLGGTKTVLSIAFKYSSTRLTVGPNGKSDFAILGYQLQQNALIPLLANTIGLNMGYIFAKEFWARISLKKDPTPAESEMVVLLACVMKPLITWNFENCSTVSRERCGGQGYLMANILGNSIGFSHAGISAEGDNAVLIQKVSKELLAGLKRGTIVYPHITWNGKFCKVGLMQLVYLREQVLAALLAGNMDKKMKEGGALFEVWMGQESDNIQALGRAFGDRISASAFAEKAKGESEMFGHVFEIIQNNLANYLTLGLMTVPQGVLLSSVYAAKVKTVSAFALKLVDFIGVDSSMIRAPIAGDWVEYNTWDNQGELIKPKL